MEIGKFIRKAFNLYLDHPVIIIPFLFLGIINVATGLWLENYISELLPILQSPTELFIASLTGILSSAIIRVAVAALLVTIITSLASSYVEAYSIGLARAMSTKKDISFKEGFPALKRGLSIFSVKLLVLVIIAAVAFGVSIPLVILFKLAGVLMALVVLLVFAIALLVITFFAPQSIVLEKRGAWGGIKKSYVFIKNHLEEVAILLLFMLFAFVIFTALQQVGITLAENFISEYVVILVSSGIHLLLFSMVFAPYFVVLKTYFYFKKSR